MANERQHKNGEDLLKRSPPDKTPKLGIRFTGMGSAKKAGSIYPGKTKGAT